MSHAPPLAGFLDALRREGLPVGVDDHIKLSALLAREASWNPAMLRTVLRCVLAKDQREQALFDRVFDGYFAGFVPRPVPEAPAGEQPDPQPQDGTEPDCISQRPPRRWGAAAALLALVCLPMLAALVFQVTDMKDDGPESHVQGGELVVSHPQRELDPAEDHSAAWLEASALASAGIACCGLAGLLGRRRRRGHAVFLPGPFRYRPRLREAGGLPAFDDSQVEDAAASLTFRSSAQERRRLDPELTAKYTAEAGGYPRVAWQKPPAAPEIAVLLDQAPRAAGWLSMYVDLFARLHRAGVKLALYGYHEEPSVCWPLGGSPGGSDLPLEELLDRVDSLVLVGDGRAGMDELDERPAQWHHLLERFPRRLWLNPLPPSRWPRGAWSLAESTPMEQGTIAGLSALAENTGTPKLRSLEDRPLTPVALRAPASQLGLGQLEQHLGPAFPWLCACGLLGEPDPAKAHWLGASFFSQCKEGDRLRLITLPWFASGRWPGDLQGALADRLRQRHPGLERKVREAYGQLVQDDPPPLGSLAWLDWRLERARNMIHLGEEHATEELLELSGTPLGDEVDQILRGMVDEGSTAEHRNGVILSNEAVAMLSPESQRQLRRTLGPGRGRRLAQFGTGLLGVVMLALALSAAQQLLWPEPPPEEPVLVDEAKPDEGGGGRVEVDVDPESLHGDVGDHGHVEIPTDDPEPASGDPISGDRIEAQIDDLAADAKAAEELRRKHEMEAEILEQSPLLKLMGTRGEAGQEDLESLSDIDMGEALAERDGAAIGDLTAAAGGEETKWEAAPTKTSSRVSSGTVDVSGGDPAKIKATISKYTGQVRACHERRLKSDPELSGRVELLWYITGGRVTSVQVLGNTTGDSELASCIALKVKTWRFPSDLEPDTEVMYPFILTPG